MFRVNNPEGPMKSAVGRSSRSAVVVVLLAVAACSPATLEPDKDVLLQHSAGLTEVSSFGSNPGGLKMYKYVPAGVGAHAPLVLVLHGCVQSAADYEKAGWNALADKYKFLLVYGEQQTNNNSMRCFNWAGEYGDP